jgi:hypothetical protein
MILTSPQNKPIIWPAVLMRRSMTYRCVLDTEIRHHNSTKAKNKIGLRPVAQPDIAAENQTHRK